MKEVSSLARELKAHLPWHQARIVFLAQFMRSLLRSRFCNFYRVAEAFQSKVQTESSYCRIKRFFACYTYCYEQLERLILQWLNLDRYTLCMESELVGKQWFQWLEQQGICYRSRIKSNAMVGSKSKLKSCSGRWDSIVCRGTQQVSGIELYLAGRRTNKDLLIVVSSQRPDMMIEYYYQRWHIETLFGCLKSRGFDLEATHMTELDRMDKLMGILALAFTWCLLRGQPHHGEAKHLLLNRHYRLAKSLFRLGLDMLRFQT